MGDFEQSEKFFVASLLRPGTIDVIEPQFYGLPSFDKLMQGFPSSGTRRMVISKVQFHDSTAAGVGVGRRLWFGERQMRCRRIGRGKHQRRR